jgi:hypothetical protein
MNSRTGKSGSGYSNPKSNEKIGCPDFLLDARIEANACKPRRDGHLIVGKMPPSV